MLVLIYLFLEQTGLVAPKVAAAKGEQTGRRGPAGGGTGGEDPIWAGILGRRGGC